MSGIETEAERAAWQEACDRWVDRYGSDMQRETFLAGWVAGRDWARQELAEAEAWATHMLGNVRQGGGAD